MGKMQLRFYWSCSSAVMKDDTQILLKHLKYTWACTCWKRERLNIGLSKQDHFDNAYQLQCGRQRHIEKVKLYHLHDDRVQHLIVFTIHAMKRRRFVKVRCIGCLFVFGIFLLQNISSCLTLYNYITNEALSIIFQSAWLLPYLSYIWETTDNQI